MQDNIIDRRSFFKLGLLGGSVVAASTIGGGAVLKAAELTHSHQASQGKSNKVRGRMFFQTQTEFDTLSAACERIYPKDEQGEGAIGLGVPYFIDNQLASLMVIMIENICKGLSWRAKPNKAIKLLCNAKIFF